MKQFILSLILIYFAVPSLASDADIKEAKKTAALFIQLMENNQQEKVYELFSEAKKDFFKKKKGQAAIYNGKQYDAYCKAQQCNWTKFKISNFKLLSPKKVECTISGVFECEDGPFPNTDTLHLVFEDKQWKIDNW